MDLECKILKEKISEDEKKSGIGSLFDDEHSSAMHIKLLRDKYGEMKIENEHRKKELDRKQIAVQEEKEINEAKMSAIKKQKKDPFAGECPQPASA